jgi:transposase-like protein
MSNFDRHPNIEPTSKPVIELPAPGTMRWIARRKAEVVAAVNSGVLTLEDACVRYSLTAEELLNWQRRFSRHGVAGLRSTRVQVYRRQPAA